MSKAVNNVLYYTIGSVVKSFTSFLLIPLFANILGSAQYGVLNLLQTFSSVLAILMTFGIERSLYRLYHDYKDKEEQNRFLSTLFWTINVTSVIIFIAAVLCANSLSSVLGGVDTWRVILPVIIYTFLQTFINYSQIIIQVEQEGKSFLIISMLLLITYNVVSLLFLFCYEKSYQAMVYGNLVANAIVIPFAYLRIRKRIKFAFDWGYLKNTLRFSLPLLLMALFAWVLNMSDRMFLANFADLESLGLYSMGSKIVSIMVLFDGAIYQAYGPYFFNIANTKPENVAKPRLKSVNDTITWIVGLLAIGIVLFSNLLFHTILKPEFRGSLIYVYILITGAVLSQQTGLLNPMIYQNKNSKGISLVIIICACVSVGLNRVLIPLYGPIMAAITNLTASVCMFGLTWLLAKRNYYIKLNYIGIVTSITIIGLCSVIDITVANVFMGLLFKLAVLAVAIMVVIRVRIIDLNATKPIVDKLVEPIMNKIKKIIWA